MEHRREGPWPPVLAGGLLAGALDITYACVFWAVKADLPPTRIFQSVAAGLLGEASFEGGAATAAAGPVWPQQCGAGYALAQSG